MAEVTASVCWTAAAQTALIVVSNWLRRRENEHTGSREEKKNYSTRIKNNDDENSIIYNRKDKTS